MKECGCGCSGDIGETVIRLATRVAALGSSFVVKMRSLGSFLAVGSS